MRNAIQNGKLRILLALLLGALGASLVLFSWDVSFGDKFLSNGSKIAFVTAAFAVTAYNLRTRVIDLILKIEAAPSKTDMLCSIASQCGRRLTNLVILFVVTAALMGSLGLLSPGGMGKGLAAIAAFMFLSSCVHFVYVLFAFERLEKFMLDDVRNKAEARELKRLGLD